MNCARGHIARDLSLHLKQAPCTLTQKRDPHNIVLHDPFLHVKEKKEAEQTLKSDPSTNSWPSKGNLEMTDVTMRYRAGLPAVLRSVRFQVLYYNS